MERVEELLKRLVKLCGGEPDDIVIKAYTKEICQEIGIIREEESPSSIYTKVLKEIEEFGKLNYKTESKVASVLVGRDMLVSLEVAKGISQFYGRIPKTTIREALEHGEIQGSIPQKKEVSVSYGYGTGTHTGTRQQTIASYKFNVKSLIRWLENHYTCWYSPDSLIGKCLANLKKD